ncbi:hypothetical protein [Pseudoalteromonas sp. G4]|uniref:hypothetical protein n=1 Tax=Pseudoalteromonas sp. G4 TaxID=2992761 RepID=UPI00237E291B|nr:hypothetical protein [Pseudoalteromonas sp. G4]
MLGVYLGKHAQNQMERDTALSLMEVTKDAINHPMLELAMAKTLLAENQFKAAQTHLAAAKVKFPDNTDIASLLNKVQSL